MTRCAIYARYSTDGQNDASVEDQVRLCRERADREGWEVVQVYSDRAISGASLIRPGVQQLLSDASHRGWEIVLCESLDRLSRGQRDTAHVFEALAFLGIPIETLADGRVTELHVGLKGTMNALFLKDLASKTRRGQRGVVEGGRIAGGMCYGYDPVRELKPDGTITAGLRKINETEAGVIRRIFSDYLCGLSAYKIARALNAEGVQGPRSRQWVTSTILGNPKRANGILNNELYVGVIVWNRQTFRKNPATGRRIAIPNPESEWIRRPAPQLRIIDDTTWAKAKAIMSGHAGAGMHRYQRRPKHMFSGLVHCEACGGTLAIAGGDKLQCSNFKNAGTCSNKRVLKLSVLESRVLGGLQEELLSPEAQAAWVKQYHEARRRSRATQESERRNATKALTDVRSKIANLVEAIEGGAGKALNARLRDLESQEADLAATLDSSTQPVVELQPNAVEIYRQQLADLRAAVTGEGPKRQTAMGIIRSMVARIDVAMPAYPAPMEIILHGDIEGILDLQKQKDRTPESDRSVLLVAGGRPRQDRPLFIKRMRA